MNMANGALVTVKRASIIKALSGLHQLSLLMGVINGEPSSLKRAGMFEAHPELHRPSLPGGPVAGTGSGEQAGWHIEGSPPYLFYRTWNFHFDGSADYPSQVRNYSPGYVENHIGIIRVRSFGHRAGLAGGQGEVYIEGICRLPTK